MIKVQNKNMKFDNDSCLYSSIFKIDDVAPGSKFGVVLRGEELGENHRFAEICCWFDHILFLSCKIRGKSTPLGENW